MVEKIVKVRFSLAGWKFWEWVKGNWTTVLEIGKLGFPLLLAMSFFEDKPVLVFAITGLGKLIADTMHYYLTLKKK